MSLAALHDTVGASPVDEIRFACPLNAAARWSVEGERSKAPITVSSEEYLRVRSSRIKSLRDLAET